MKIMNLRNLAVCAVVAFVGQASANTIIGNALTPQGFATDYPPAAEPYNVLVVNSASLPSAHLNAFLTFDQVNPGGSPTSSAGHQFIGYILRPVGLGNYNVVFDTGILTVPTVATDTIITYPVSFDLQAGDLFAHFGGGIPVSTSGGTDSLYYPTSGGAPVTGNTIALPGGNFPLYTNARTYSIAVSVPDGGSTIIMLGLGLIAFAGARRKLAAA